MKPPFTASYDERADVLYVTGSDNRPAVVVSDEPAIYDGVLMRFATDNGELVGFTVLGVSRIAVKSTK